MSPSGPLFLLFLGAVAIALAFMPVGRVRLAAIVIVSLVFYGGYNPWYVPLLLWMVALSFAAGVYLGGTVEGARRSTVFYSAIILALLPLLLFKYLGAFSGIVGILDRTTPISLVDLVLPIGISFYTFQAIGYIVDVYVGTVKAERSLLRFAAFLCFFPVLSAGPIERAPHLLPQLENLGKFDYQRSVCGLQAILIGLFMKVVIADSLAPLVDGAYSSPLQHGALDLALATVFFSFQVYADFAGYSLIAIGSARLLGIELLPNFAQPFLSQTLPEYWRTWHMTLSGWFRDYVFTPLQFQWRRSRRLGLAAALMATFVIVGLWHGAGPKFAIFGLVHGVLVSWSTLTLKFRDHLWRRIGVPRQLLAVVRILITFGAVTFSFVLFRASDTQEALQIYAVLVSGSAGQRTLPLAWPLTMIAALVLYDIAMRYEWYAFLERRVYLRWLAYHSATACIVVVLTARMIDGSGNAQQFIYFKF
jgi:D-alanyl-lipoteichoic acid acyltransferase DltB (MBOAT superfamily)